jgi:phage shock protein A
MSLGAWLRRVLAFLLPPDEAAEAGPVQIFEDAVRTARQRFLDLRATASPLYQSRDKLLEQEKARASEIADLTARAASLLAEGREKEALEAATRQGRIETDLARIRKELEDLARPIEQVEARLRKIESEVRDLERERDRSAALIQSAEARVAVDRILSAHSSDGGPDLASARDAVTAQLAHARALEEVSASSTASQLEELEAGMEEDGARLRLEAIRLSAQLPAAPAPAALPPGSAHGAGGKAAANLPPGQDGKEDKPL